VLGDENNDVLINNEKEGSLFVRKVIGKFIYKKKN